jgi:quercetin dioxygenase-like cupin family protein
MKTAHFGLTTDIVMKSRRLDDMKGGWFVGNFEPSLYKTNDVEVSVKRYKAGDYEQWHYHKIATEITVVISGRIEMNGQVYEKDDIVTIEPGEGTDFRALAESVNVVVKMPGANDDKYLRGE